MLSRESSAEHGKWRTDRAPYLREVMDAFSNPFIEEVWCQWGSQLGKTEVINNVVGFFIDQEPAPIIVVQPNVEPMAKAWSLDRLAPMLRDTPRLRGRVRNPRTRDSGNTILHKVFDGGHLTIGGANSAAGLASRPIRVALFDEVDRFPPTAGTEGDPVKLGMKRTDTFWNRKIGGFSSPTRKGMSRIEKAMATTNQQFYEVPCPECGHFQRLIWGKGDEPGGLKWETGKPETAKYQCVSCHKLVDESQKHRMLVGGRWVATRPTGRKVGFYLNGLYSPWRRWAEMAEDFLDASKSQETLMVFINTELGELWEEKAEQFDTTTLGGRRENYGPGVEVPDEVKIVIGSVDVQGDRLEFEVRGWGLMEESWLIAHYRILGDPEQPEVWQRLETLRIRPYLRANGSQFRIRATGIDTGAMTQAVYKYVRPRQGQNVRALKGVSVRGAPLVGRPSKVNRHGVRVWPIGTDTGKDVLFARLKGQKAGPGYLHFCPPQSDGADDEYLNQYGAEKVVSRFHKGVRIREYVKIRDRNEAIDLYVYNLATLYTLGRAITESLNRVPLPEPGKPETSTSAQRYGEEDPEPSPEPDSSPSRPTRKGWLNRWKR